VFEIGFQLIETGTTNQDVLIVSLLFTRAAVRLGIGSPTLHQFESPVILIDNNVIEVGNPQSVVSTCFSHSTLSLNVDPLDPFIIHQQSYRHKIQSQPSTSRVWA
jgi:hypothetical protein